MTKMITVVGARPQFIKAAALSNRLRDPDFAGIEEVLVHTGQHYDPNMSDVFFQELNIPAPQYNLGVGSGSHGVQTAGIMTALESVLAEERPDLVLIYGDTNSTLAAAIVAAKAGVPIAHVEAGLRSFRSAMPEEVNRVVADRLSQILYCPTAEAVANLKREGRPDAINVGDIMLDGFNQALGRTDPSMLQSLGVTPGGYVLATIHRAESTDDTERLHAIVDALGRYGQECPVLLPLHPRTRGKIADAGIKLAESIRVIEPLSYLSMVAAIGSAAVIATDSGGLQKEACFARVPCVTLRDETEWVETVETGWNRLPTMTSDGIVAALREAAGTPGSELPDYGDGDAAGRILRHLKQALA